MANKGINLNEPGFIESLKQGTSASFRALYEEVWPQVVGYVLRNSGGEEEAQDIFQESMIVLVRYLKKPDFELKVQINTLLMAIAKNLWLKQLKKNKKQLPLNTELDQPDEVDEELHWQEEDLDRKCLLVKGLLQMISEDCQKLLTEYYFDKKQLKQIGEEMGYSDGFVRVKKVRCITELRKKLLNHPEFVTENN